MYNLAKVNSENKYILTCIDILSKFSWPFPLKTKTAENIIKCFKKISKQGRIPLKLQSYGGREFNNNSFCKYMKEKGVHFLTTKNETKCTIVERFNRTLKEKNVEIFHS